MLVAALIIIRIVGIPPRLLAVQVERRTLGHNVAVEKAGKLAGALLLRVDRGAPRSAAMPALLIGASDQRNRAAPVTGIRRIVAVSSVVEATRAVEDAQPGDVITFLPGRYRFFGRALVAARAGQPDVPVRVRAPFLGEVVLEFDMLEGFHVLAPYWQFENLVIRGVCRDHSYCEHAFHVVGRATHFEARNNLVLDFNAHFKINGDKGWFPDFGLIEGNTISNGAVRQTENPVTPIDIVAADDWTIEHNIISDFIKGGGDQTSYGAFAKGAARGTRFEGNIILCEQQLQGQSGRRVGLSFGGGGSEPQRCRDGRCITEHAGGAMQNNLIAFCSDDGIYLNRAADSRISHNTLIDTAGITVRFAESSARISGNLVDGILRSRDDGIVHQAANRTTGLVSLYFGYHPVRALFTDAMQLDLGWRGAVARRRAPSDVAVDLCGINRPVPPAFGAFEDFSACLAH